MAVREYVGARYVPLFADEPWTNTVEYEPLTVVLHNGDSYTSRQYVPVGIDIDNKAYWAETGNFNAQYNQVKTTANAALFLANESLKKFPNQASIDVTGLKFGETIYIEGAREKNDGGCGAFEYSNTADTSVFSINKGSYFLNAVSVPVFNVGCIGTVNDGSTDNTAIVNAWAENVEKPVVCVFPTGCLFNPQGLSKLPVGSVAMYNQIVKDGNYTWNSETFLRISTESNDLANVFSSTQAPNIWLHNTGDVDSTSSKLGRASIYFASGWEAGGLPDRCMRIGGTWNSENKEYYQLTIGDHEKSVAHVNENGFATVGSLNPRSSTLCVNNNITNSGRLLELINNNDSVADIMIINSNGHNINLRSLADGGFYLRNDTNNIARLTSGNGLSSLMPIETLGCTVSGNVVTPLSYPNAFIKQTVDIKTIELPAFFTLSANSATIITLIFEVAGATVSSGGNISITDTFTSTVGSTIKLYKRNALSANWIVLS